MTAPNGMKISDRMAGLLVMIRIDGWVSWPVRGGTYWALERRGLVEGPVPHPDPKFTDWPVARLTEAGSKFLDDKGVAPTPVRCPHCNGSGRLGPSPLTAPLRPRTET